MVWYWSSSKTTTTEKPVKKVPHPGAAPKYRLTVSYSHGNSVWFDFESSELSVNTLNAINDGIKNNGKTYQLPSKECGETALISLEAVYYADITRVVPPQATDSE